MKIVFLQKLIYWLFFFYLLNHDISDKHLDFLREIEAFINSVVKNGTKNSLETSQFGYKLQFITILTNFQYSIIIVLSSIVITLLW